MVERVEAPTRPRAVQRLVLVPGLVPAELVLVPVALVRGRVDSAALVLVPGASAARVRGRAASAALVGLSLPPWCSSARAWTTPARGSTPGMFDAGEDRQLWATET